jgi:hypothetical protein
MPNEKSRVHVDQSRGDPVQSNACEISSSSVYVSDQHQNKYKYSSSVYASDQHQNKYKYLNICTYIYFGVGHSRAHY